MVHNNHERSAVALHGTEFWDHISTSYTADMPTADNTTLAVFADDTSLLKILHYQLQSLPTHYNNYKNNYLESSTNN